jgi:hypothetical protein
MNLGRRLSVSSLSGSAAAFGLLLSGCLGVPEPAATSDPLVITEAGPGEAADSARARAALLAEMRAEAEASAAQAGTGVSAALRPEPRSAVEVAAIEAELQLIARRRAASANPQEIAALEARAKELKRLAAAAQAGPMRR